MLTHRQQVLGAGSAWNLIALLGALTYCALLFGCEGPPPRQRDWSETPIAASPRAQAADSALTDESRERHRLRDRSLRIHMNADPGSLNPIDDPSVWALRIVMDTVFETLVRYQGSGDKGTYQSGIARSWTVGPGGREIRFLLHEDAHWQDGKALTSLDVQFSIEAAASRRVKAEHHRRALADVSSIEIIGRHEVRVRLARRNAFVLRELASIPIVPEHIYVRSITQRAGKWIGSGPYRVSSGTEGNIVLERDPDYWGRKPAIERIEFVREQDAAKALRDAKEGTIDIVPELIAAHFPEQLHAPGIDQKFSTIELAPATLNYLVLNTRRPPFEDSGVRRAIRQLLDSSALVDAAGGLARQVSGPVWPGGPGNGTPTKLPAFSVSEAHALLDAAGWRDDDGDGVRAREGQRLMITVLVTEAKDAGRELTLAALRKAGFVLDVRVGSTAVLEKRLRAGEFDLAFATWLGDVDRDLSPLLATGGSLNFGGFHSPVIDELFEEIRAAWDPGARVDLLGRLSQALKGSMPIVCQPAPSPRGLVHRRVSGLVVWNNWFSLRDLKLVDD